LGHYISTDGIIMRLKCSIFQNKFVFNSYTYLNMMTTVIIL